MTEILVLCPFGLDPGLVCRAAEMGRAACLVPEAQAEEAARYGAEKLYCLFGAEAADEAHFAAFLAPRLRHWGIPIILAPATVPMRNLMPLLAWHLNAGLTADCTGLSLEGERLIQVRPAFGSALVAEIQSQRPVQMATVRPGTFRPQDCRVKTPLREDVFYDAGGAGVRLLSKEPYREGVPLTQARIILAGGMGIGSREGFQKLAELASLLGAGLAASRKAVDAGLAPYRCQVGMTGVTVAPRLYIAVGISGAVQHLAGMTGAEKIIAINSDPKAPIFDYADYGIVGDWEKIVDQLLKEESL